MTVIIQMKITFLNEITFWSLCGMGSELIYQVKHIALIDATLN